MSTRTSHTMSSQVNINVKKLPKTKRPALDSHFNSLVIFPTQGPYPGTWVPIRTIFVKITTPGCWKNLTVKNNHPWLLEKYLWKITTHNWDFSVGESYSNAAAKPDTLKNASNQHLPGYLLLINILSSILGFAIELNCLISPLRIRRNCSNLQFFCLSQLSQLQTPILDERVSHLCLKWLVPNNLLSLCW